MTLGVSRVHHPGPACVGVGGYDADGRRRRRPRAGQCRRARPGPPLRQRWGQEKETDSFCFLLLRSHDDLGEQSRRKPSRGIDAREASRTLTGGGCTELGEVGHGRSEAEAWVLVRRRSRQRGAPASGRRCPRAGQGRRRRASRTIYGRRLQVLLPESYGRRGTAPPCSRIRLAGGRSVGGMGEGEGEGWEWGRRRRWVG